MGEIASVRDLTAAEFDDKEKAVLSAVDSMIDDGTIDDHTWAKLRGHYPDDSEMIELLATIANWRMVSSLLRSLQVPLDEKLPLWPPDGGRIDDLV